MKVGDDVIVSNNKTEDEFPLKIVGIVEQRKSVPRESFMIGLPPSRGPPLTHGPAVAALYVPWTLAEKLAGTPAKIDFAGVVLTKGIKIGEFRAHWADQFAQANPPAEIQAQEDVGAELQQSSTSESIRGQALSATGISLLAALFIIFTTLNMGVDERIRQFAMLRAVSLTKVQVGAMIAMESLFLGLIGWGGGLLAGWGLLKIVNHLRPAFFPMGVSLGFWCIALSGICALGRIAGGLRHSRVEGHASQSAGGHGGAPACAVGALLLGRHPDWPAPDLHKPARRVLHSDAGHRALCRLGDFGLPRDGYRIRALGAADDHVHRKDSRARCRPPGGRQLAVAGHAAYEQSLANRGNHGGADHRSRAVRRHANLGLFHARTFCARRLGARPAWSA